MGHKWVKDKVLVPLTGPVRKKSKSRVKSNVYGEKGWEE